jgi:hypothetical protein
VLRVKGGKSLLLLGHPGYISTIHQSLLHSTLSPTVHFNGSNGTAYTRPSMVQNMYIPIRIRAIRQNVSEIRLKHPLSDIGNGRPIFNVGAHLLNHPPENPVLPEAESQLFHPQGHIHVCSIVLLQKQIIWNLLFSEVGTKSVKAF